MKLNQEAIRQLMSSRGWSEVKLARKLGMDYSYTYRVLREQRGMGKKFITGLMKFCESEGLDFKEFIILHPENTQQ